MPFTPRLNIPLLIVAQEHKEVSINSALNTFDAACVLLTEANDFTEAVTISDSLTFADGVNIVAGTGTGLKIGTSTTQKLGFFDAPPVVQRPATTDLRQVAIDLGFLATGGVTPLNLNDGLLTAGGSAASPSRFTAIDASSNTVAFPLAIRHENSGGAGAIGMGAGVFFEVESTTGGVFNSIGSFSVETLTNVAATADGQVRIRVAIAGTQTSVMRISSKRARMEQAPSASANNGMFNLGDQGFEGGGGTAFAGSASGTGYATNFAAGYVGNHIDCQLAGVSQFKVTSAGALVAGASTLAATTVTSMANAGTYGGNGTAFAPKKFTMTFASDADYTLGVGEKDAWLIDIQTDAVLTAPRNIIVPTTSPSFYIVINRNARAIGFKTSGGTAISVASGRSAMVMAPTGTNMFRLTPDTDYTV